MADVLKGLIVGFIAGVCVFYAFQTRVVYPYWVTMMWDHPWMFVVAGLCALGLAPWSVEASVLLLLCLAALLVDKLVFASKHIPKQTTSVPSAWESRINTKPPVDHIEDSPIEFGEPLAAPTLLSHPDYPLFYGIDQPQSGPAPF